MFIHRYSIYPDFSVNSALRLMQCGYEECSPSHYFGPVSRDHHLLHFITKGCGILELAGKTYHLKAGQGFYIPTGVPSKYIADDVNPWHYSWMGFDGSDSTTALSYRNLTGLQPIFNFDNNGTITEIFTKLCDIYEREGNDFLSISYMYRILSLINPEFKIDQSKNTSFQQMMTYIKNNFQLNLTIESMANHFHISPSQLFREFKKHTGISPQLYIKQYRIFYAARLLSTTNLSVNQISTICGYHDNCNFSKQFKSIYQRSPASYRKFIHTHANAVWNYDNSPDVDIQPN